MNVTFLIGNGFDLNLGMKTSYQDVYKKYIEAPSSSPIILKLKNELNDNYSNWADFEMGMANFASRELTEDQLVECVRDFRNYLTQYLHDEQTMWLRKVGNGEKLNIFVDEFKKSYQNFFNNLIPNEKRTIERQVSNSKARNFGVYYNTITYNYTGILDYFVNQISKNNSFFCPVIHPHGDLKNGIVLGIDNDKQIGIPLSNKGRRTFVKTFFNRGYDFNRVEQALKQINGSDCVCIYGFSLGESDLMWRNALAEWLTKDENNYIVWFAYEVSSINMQNKDEVLDEEERLKHIFLSKLDLENEYDEFERQIFIPIEKSIFSFPSIKTIDEEDEILKHIDEYTATDEEIEAVFK